MILWEFKKKNTFQAGWYGGDTVSIKGECTCQPGFSGSRCEISKCHNYCMNDGECNLDSSNNPTCHCNLGFNGTRCQIEIKG